MPGVGGNRLLWKDVKVTAVEIDPKIAKAYADQFPEDDVIVGDAMSYLLEHYKEFDGVWASPPCQKHSKMMKATRHNIVDYFDPMLWQLIVFLQHFYKGNWIVENVVPYYKPLIEPQLKVGRHLFWSNRPLFGIEDVKRPKGFITKSNSAGAEELKKWLGIKYEGNIYYGKNHCPAQVLRNCVHPKIGEQLLKYLNHEESLTQ